MTLKSLKGHYALCLHSVESIGLTIDTSSLLIVAYTFS